MWDDHRLQMLAGMFTYWVAADNKRSKPNAADRKVGQAMAEAAWHEAQVTRQKTEELNQ